jgi:epoxyqueuosine reductase
MESITSRHSRFVKELAIRHGFMGAGIAKAERMDEEATRLKTWLSKGYHGEMGYMANHFEMRIDPTKLVPGARSVISLLYNYFPQLDLAPPSKGVGGFSENDVSHDGDQLTTFKISRYAYGEDYHKVVRRKLKALVRDLKVAIGDFHSRVFVDSAPVMERDWAKRSGQGWIGKNTLLIHPKKGSYFFLAEIILDVEMAYDHPIRDHCGTCTKCIDACPTDAISPEGYILDGSKCISYLTIELKERIPETYKGHMEGWIFGCDICQEVCPWNRFSTPHGEPAFEPSDQLRGMENRDWLELREDVFDALFSKSPLKRAGYNTLKNTIEFTFSPSDDY